MRDTRELAYFDVDGRVVHGYVGAVKGRRLSPAEVAAHLVWADSVRQQERAAAALTSESASNSVSAPDPRVDELKAELAAQRTMIAELVSALKEATK